MVWVIVAAAIVVWIVGLWLIMDLSNKSKRKKRCEATYRKAVSQMDGGDYENAAFLFEALGDYKDSAQLCEKCKPLSRRMLFDRAVALMDAGKYSDAILEFSDSRLDGEPTEKMIEECRARMRERDYRRALEKMEAGEYNAARQAFESLAGYGDSRAKGLECERLKREAGLRRNYEDCVARLEKGELLSAARSFRMIPDGYADKAALGERLYAALYEAGVERYEKGKGDYSAGKQWFPGAKSFLEELPRDYRDADDYMRSICQALYGSDFCPDSPYYKHDWENLEHVVEVDKELRKIGHGRRRCKYCGIEEDFSYDYDTDGY